MNKSLFVVAAVVALALLFGEAKAAAFCSYGHEGKQQCSFNTWEQCRAFVSGNGGFCERNPHDPALWADRRAGPGDARRR